jgi:cell division GTPase FtsZ
MTLSRLGFLTLAGAGLAGMAGFPPRARTAPATGGPSSATLLACAPRVLAVGVGGAGTKILSLVHPAALPDARRIDIATDPRSLDPAHAEVKLPIGWSPQRGCGCAGSL